MIEFTSDELKIIMNAIEFYKYEMNKTDNMDDYRVWKSAQKKYEDNLKYYRGTWSMKEEE